MIFKSAILLLLFLCCISGISFAGPYSISAHGNSAYGVVVDLLNTPPNKYSRGNCGHCHSNKHSGDMNYKFNDFINSQADIFCYRCHQSPVNSSQVSMHYQYSYSRMAGGDTKINCPDNIKDAFQFIDVAGNSQINCGSVNGSSHFLKNISTFIQNKWDFGSKNINPCLGCHNVHKAQRASYPIGDKGTSPLSLPSSHNQGWDLWGDDITERMNIYTTNYQAPYASNSKTFEPNADGTFNGSNMPDYITFCLDCHKKNYDTQMVSAQRNNFTNNFAGNFIRNPDWDISPHGKTDGVMNDNIKRKAPYTTDKNYVLSCMDCHEAHGSPNGLLIRKTVNGESTVDFTDWTSRESWLSLCRRCHVIDNEHNKNGGQCSSCHSHEINSERTF